MGRTIKIGLIASFLLLLTVNIVMLDLVVLSNRFTARPVEMNAATTRVTPMPSPQASCLSNCEDKIEALNRKIDDMITRQNSQQTVKPSSTGSAKEYYIQLGSGLTKSSTWQDVSGAEALIDASNYPLMKSVTFEAFLNIPTANGIIQAKLYNVTDKHDVWFSELSSEGPVLTKKEAAITLEPGAKLYRVMGLSSLKYEANIQNARIRIVTY